TAPIAALQSEYSLFERSVEDDVLATCDELGIGFVAYCPLGRGVLTGRFRSPDDYGQDDSRATGRYPRVAGEHLERNAELARVVAAVAAERAATPAQVAIAWVLSRRPWIVPIPGTKRRRYHEENVGAVEVELTPADFERLDALAQVSGDRYPPGRQATW